MIKGIPASPGFAVAPVFLLAGNEISLNEEYISSEQADSEWAKFEDALKMAQRELVQTKESIFTRMGEEGAAIFESHLMILEDSVISDDVSKEIKEGLKNAAWAVSDVFHKHAEVLASLDDEYLRERAHDFKDISQKLCHFILGGPSSALDQLQNPVVLVASDLTPSQTAQLDTRYIKGIITEIGGATSHSAILSRNLQIPAVVGCGKIMNEMKGGELIALDGFKGEVLLNPNPFQADQYLLQQEEYLAKLHSMKRSANVPAATLDGKKIEVAANIGVPGDVKIVLENGADAIGLFRSEFLFLERESLPSEDEQFAAYAAVVKEMGERSTIIRTLDIGGDKHLDYLPLEKEMNPFLGLRAIRLCLDRKDLFMTQLRALLRASHYGKLRIMFPMIATENELLQARKALEEAKEALRRECIPFDEAIEVGIMIEIPSSALIADVLVKHVDFFSIGSNDLIQYTFAADRMNEKVGYLYDPGHAAVLRLIQMVVHSARKHGKWVGVCGEMAGDPAYARWLIGIGVEELSMTAGSIPAMKREIGAWSFAELEKAAAQKLQWS